MDRAAIISSLQNFYTPKSALYEFDNYASTYKSTNADHLETELSRINDKIDNLKKLPDDNMVAVSQKSYVEHKMNLIKAYSEDCEKIIRQRWELISEIVSEIFRTTFNSLLCRIINYFTGSYTKLITSTLTAELEHRSIDKIGRYL